MLEKFLRNVKSVNTRNDVAAFHIIVFPPSTERLLAFLALVPKVLENAGFKVEMAYTHLEKNYAKSPGICNIMNNKNYFPLLRHFAIYVQDSTQILPAYL